MDNEKKTITFVEGIDHIKKINDTFFYVKFNVEEFHKWANQHKRENGCVYINLCQSKQSDMWYGKLSTYTGKQLNQMEYEDYKKKQAEKEQSEEIPFWLNQKLDPSEFIEGVHTIKEINPDYFFIRLIPDMFIKWLEENKPNNDIYMDFNLIRNDSEYFFIKRAKPYKIINYLD